MGGKSGVYPKYTKNPLLMILGEIWKTRKSEKDIFYTYRIENRIT